MAAQLNDTVGIYPQQYEEKKMEEKTANMAENIRVTFTEFHYIKEGNLKRAFWKRSGQLHKERNL